MLLSSITIYVLLRLAARLRRQRIDHKKFEMRHQERDAPSVVHFRDRKGVENLLKQSAASPAPAIVTAATRDSNNNTTTSTSSGSAIGYNVPVLERLRAERVRKYRYSTDDRDIESIMRSIDER
jgi:hypothetical protein